MVINVRLRYGCTAILCHWKLDNLINFSHALSRRKEPHTSTSLPTNTMATNSASLSMKAGVIGKHNTKHYHFLFQLQHASMTLIQARDQHQHQHKHKHQRQHTWTGKALVPRCGLEPLLRMLLQLRAWKVWSYYHLRHSLFPDTNLRQHPSGLWMHSASTHTRGSAAYVQAAAIDAACSFCTRASTNTNGRLVTSTLWSAPMRA